MRRRELCSLSDPLVDLCVQWEVFDDGEADVRTPMDGVEFVAVDGDG